MRHSLLVDVVVVVEAEVVVEGVVSVATWESQNPKDQMPAARIVTVHHIHFMEVDAEVVVEGVAELELTLVAGVVTVHHSCLVAVDSVVEVEGVESWNLQDLTLVARVVGFMLKLLSVVVVARSSRSRH